MALNVAIYRKEYIEARPPQTTRRTFMVPLSLQKGATPINPLGGFAGSQSTSVLRVVAVFCCEISLRTVCLIVGAEG
jgi:hypothetical protein